MPFDSNGVFSLTPGYLAVTGQTILPSNHNPPLEDIALQGLSAVLVRDGRAPMTGNLNMGNFKITNLLAGTATTDAVNKAQLDTLATSIKGYLFGLTLSNNAIDATNDIDIAAGVAASDGAIPVPMTLASTLTKRLDAAWAVGSGNGGLDTGSIANSTYHIWLIQRSDTGVVDALFSVSPSSPTMPANYDRKRRIGSIMRVGGAIKAFIQDGDDFQWVTATQDISATNPGASAVTRTMTLPSGIRVKGKFYVGFTASAAGDNPGAILLSDLSTADLSPSSAQSSIEVFGTAAGTYAGGATTEAYTNTSAQIRSRLQLSGANTVLAISTAGWRDNRGRV